MTIKDFDGLGDDAAVRYMDAAADNDMRVLMGFNRPAGGSVDVLPEPGRAQRRQRIQRLRDHRALLGWYAFDEPDGQVIDNALLYENRHMIESLDPVHPTLTALCVPDRFADYASGIVYLNLDLEPHGVRAIQVQLEG